MRLQTSPQKKRRAMPHKRSTTIRIDDDGNVQPSGEGLVRWLADQFELFADGKAVITVERPKRSLSQNSHYWGYVIRPIRQALLEAGHPVSAEALHEHFKALFLGATRSYEYTDRETGEVHEVVQVRSSTDLDKTEFSDFVERIRGSELVRQLGVYIPMPGDPDEAFLEAKSQ